MALDDYLDSEVGIAVAATALVLSPQVRTRVRRGLVYMLAGAMRAGDVLATASRGMATDAKQAMPSEPNSAHPTADQARPTPSAQRASRAQKVT